MSHFQSFDPSGRPPARPGSPPPRAPAARPAPSQPQSAPQPSASGSGIDDPIVKLSKLAADYSKLAKKRSSEVKSILMQAGMSGDDTSDLLD